MAWAEDSVIARLMDRFERPRSRRVRVGVGDDAAVLSGSGVCSVLSVDTAVEHVHFERRWLSWQDVGYRSTQAALSDLAAMAAQPLAILSSLILPGSVSEAHIDAIGAGQAEAAVEHGAALVGGNVARGGELSVTTTVLGEVDVPLLRAGARAGDELWLVGQVGLAAAGLELLSSGSRRLRSSEARACLEAWRRPKALVREGRALARAARAAMDLSDGLAADAPKLARASGVRLVIEATLLEGGLDPALVRVAEREGWNALELALIGGEDYALLAAGPAQRRPRHAWVIGNVERGQGVVLRGAPHRRLPRGFEHRS